MVKYKHKTPLIFTEQKNLNQKMAISVFNMCCVAKLVLTTT